MEQKTFAYEAAGQTLVIHLPREIDHHNCKKLKICLLYTSRCV